jgi:hypothetical protein
VGLSLPQLGFPRVSTVSLSQFSKEESQVFVQVYNNKRFQISAPITERKGKKKKLLALEQFKALYEARWP